MCLRPATPRGAYYLYALQARSGEPKPIGRLSQVRVVAGRLLPDDERVYRPTTYVFDGVRVYALDRASMISGGPTQRDRVYDRSSWRG